ncbi:MAG: AAA family ATPase, partial [Pseudomonadota bacterium]|nr:AAA family ATPase [Pseudomonadota bacterium]
PAMAAPAPDKLPPHRERDLPELVETLEGLSTSLSLQTKDAQKKPAATAPQQMPSGSNAAAAGADKGHGGLAPSLTVLDLLLKHLPNDAQYDDYRDWLAIVTAVRGASWKQSWEEEALDALQVWCAKWGGDPKECETQWNRIKVCPGLGWVRLKYELRTHNPNTYAEVKRAEAAATFTKDSLLDELLERFKNQPQNSARGFQLGSASSVKIAPMAAVSAKQIAPRKFLYGTSIIAGFISVLVAPGGTGKSALATAEAISMATGKTLFPHQAPHRPLTVWMHNAEDPKEEQQRRVVAALKHYELTFAELGERLILTSGRDLPLILAKDGTNGAEPVRDTIDSLIEEMNANNVDVLVLDPLGATHTLPENDNSAANVLLGVLREICDRTGAAIVLVHHTSKAAGSDMSGAGANASRGASAIVDGARNVRQLVPMTKNEATKLNVSEEERRSLFRVANGKANLAPMAAATWRKLTTIALGNGTQDYPKGDSVAVVEPWETPGPARSSEQDLKRVQDAMRAASEPYRLDQRSDNWIGHLIAHMLDLDIGASVTKPNRSQEQKVNRQYVRGVLKDWMDDGAIITETIWDSRPGRGSKIVVVGRAAHDAGPCAPELASAFGDPTDGGTAPQSQKQTVAQSGAGVKT